LKEVFYACIKLDPTSTAQPGLAHVGSDGFFFINGDGTARHEEDAVTKTHEEHRLANAFTESVNVYTFEALDASDNSGALTVTFARNANGHATCADAGSIAFSVARDEARDENGDAACSPSSANINSLRVAPT